MTGERSPGCRLRSELVRCLEPTCEFTLPGVWYFLTPRRRLDSPLGVSHLFTPLPSVTFSPSLRLSRILSQVFPTLRGVLGAATALAWGSVQHVPPPRCTRLPRGAVGHLWHSLSPSAQPPQALRDSSFRVGRHSDSSFLLPAHAVALLVPGPPRPAEEKVEVMGNNYPASPAALHRPLPQAPRAEREHTLGRRVSQPSMPCVSPARQETFALPT